jgi:hypothetical protein
MPTSETLEKFIARVTENKHAEAIDEFYLENGSIQENQGEPRVGRAALVAGERAVMARALSVTSRCIRPVFVSGNKVVIRWVFEFQWLTGGKTRMEEIAYQTWEGEKIASETFFYDPAQRTPK